MTEQKNTDLLLQASQALIDYAVQVNALTARIATMQYELDAIPAIKAERDAYAKAADTMAAAHKVECDALKADAERYRYLRSKQMQYSLPNNTVAMLVSDMTALDATMKEIK